MAGPKAYSCVLLEFWHVHIFNIWKVRKLDVFYLLCLALFSPCLLHWHTMILKELAKEFKLFELHPFVNTSCLLVFFFLKKKEKTRTNQCAAAQTCVASFHDNKHFIGGFLSTWNTYYWARTLICELAVVYWHLFLEQWSWQSFHVNCFCWMKVLFSYTLSAFCSF